MTVKEAMTKFERLVNYFEGCGYTNEQAKKEVNSIVRYHTTGADAVSYEYALDMMIEDLLN